VAGLKLQYPAEAEPNDSMAGAQMLDLGGVIEGNIVNGDAGYTWTSGAPTDLFQNKAGAYKVEDFYKVTCCKTWECGTWPNVHTCYGITVTLDFTGGSGASPDIDFYLFNTVGTAVLQSSTRDNVGLNSYTETIYTTNFTYTDMGATFYLGVQAWDVPTGVTYKIKFE
jgi:hypothetical protein